MTTQKTVLLSAPLLVMLSACDDQPAPACPPAPDTWLGLAHDWGPGIGGGITLMFFLWLWLK